MLVYGLLIFIPIAIQHIKISNKIEIAYKNNRRAIYFFWVMLFFIIVLKHESIGNDTQNYMYIFNWINKNDWVIGLGRSVEIGYNFINKIVSVFTNNFRILLVVTTFLSIYFMAKAYIKYLTDASLSISIFIILSNFMLLFSGIRQAIAISFGFIAFEFVRQKKFVLFCFSVIIAMLFHFSSFMLFFMYPLYYIRITKKRLITVIPLLLLIFIFNNQVFGLLTAILSMFTKYEGSINHTGAYTMLLLFVAFLIFSFLIPEEKSIDEVTLGMRNFLIFSVFLQMFAPLHSIAMRMNYYYIVFIPILIPRIINYRRERWSQVAIVARHIMVVFFVIYFFVVAPKENVLNTFPYHFLWENI